MPSLTTMSSLTTSAVRELEHAIQSPIQFVQSGSVHQDLNNLATENSNKVVLSGSGEIVGLSISNRELQELPPIIFELTELRVLRLHQLQLHELSTRVSNLSNLVALYAPLNRLRAIPNELLELTHLKTLGLNSNEITSLSNRLPKSTSIETLSLAQNPLDHVPSGLRNLVKLRRFHLDRTRIESIDIEESWVCGLTDLTLSDTPIRTIAGTPGKPWAIRRLKVSGTRLEAFPAALAEMQSLCELDISRTAVDQVPRSLAKLQQLESLDLSETRISGLPEDLPELLCLRKLRLDRTPIERLPHLLARLPALTSLSLGGIQLGSVPDFLREMHHLEDLDLSMCRLTELPEWLLASPTIRFINAAGNRIRTLPRSVCKHELLTFPAYTERQVGIAIYDNPLESPPPEIVARGRSAVDAYFESLATGAKPLNELKLLLVGDGGAGKTSLVRRLLKAGFNSTEPQTDGINIALWPIDYQGRSLTARVWDFGGQEVMHATHQFFLSRRSLYVVVLDSRRDERADYWLQHVKVFGGNSPVLVVKNKIDENPGFDLNERILREQFPNIAGFYPISCMTGEGIPALRSELEKNLARIKHAQTKWPETWFTVKNHLESSTSEYIGLSQFRAICKSNGVSTNGDQRTLLRFLHDLGVLLHFPDLALRDTNVINPSWVTSGVYQIINSRQLADGKGTLLLASLSDVLDGDRHPAETHNFLIEIMKKFELCYSLDGKTVLFPSLLPAQEPATPDFTGSSVIRFNIRYEFLPKAVIARFLVRMHDEVMPGRLWRTGGLLQSRHWEAMAFIRANDEKRVIEVRVDGRNSREYLTIIVHTLRLISRSFSGIQFVERLVLPDNPAVDVSFEHLLTLEGSGHRAFIPEGSRREYQVSELLGRLSSQPSETVEILALLRKLATADDTPESLAEKLNKVIYMRPNLFGLGVDLNEAVRRFLKRGSK